TVYIGEVPGKTIYLMQACPPYESDERYRTDELNTIVMMGTKYLNSIALRGDVNSYALFNLNGKYSSLEFDFGHVDNTAARDSTYDIYLDGEYLMSIDGTSDMLVQHITIPLNGALQLKIHHSDIGNTGEWPYYAFGNAILK
ncbi:MAG: NPCBM/NEW2 domain-containing protein, partial [Oscillospiraceae bacterium]|nr:NPCBM/NEW2 domain-containing protein [Oscillospiraceae bacterium]